jgi:DNA-binding XRE family transcriptional regulator
MDQKHPLTKWRAENNLTQGELATEVKVTRWMINRIELRERSPSLTLATRIRNFTKGEVSLDDLATSKAAAE